MILCTVHGGQQTQLPGAGGSWPALNGRGQRLGIRSVLEVLAYPVSRLQLTLAGTRNALICCCLEGT